VLTLLSRPLREEYLLRRLDELDGTIPLEEIKYLEEDKKGNIKKIDITQSPFLGKLFREWISERKADGIAVRTRENYLTSFMKFLRVIKYRGKDIESLEVITPQDLIEFKKVCRNETAPFFTKSQSLRNHILNIRMFCIWLSSKLRWDNKDKFLEVKSPKITDKKRIEPEDLISVEEIQTLLRHASNSRDKCLISLCFELGPRISELLEMQIKDVQFEETHMNLKLKGKKNINALRRVTSIESQQYMKAWLNDHPYRNDPEAPLFVNISKNFGSPVRYDAARGIINRIIKRSGLRHINWHLFRHTAATTDAVRGMNPAMMNKKYGWSKESKTPLIYIAISDSNLEDYELERRGIKVSEKEERKRALEPKVCPRCAKINEATNIVCGQCGSALDPEILARQLEQEKSEREQEMESMMGILLDKRLREFLQDKVKEVEDEFSVEPIEFEEPDYQLTEDEIKEALRIAKNKKRKK
jgi:site-specific recombinase XerD